MTSNIRSAFTLGFMFLFVNDMLIALVNYIIRMCYYKSCIWREWIMSVIQVIYLLLLPISRGYYFWNKNNKSGNLSF